MTTVLERIRRRSALAVRLTDLATGRPIRHHIAVATWPTGRPERAETTRRFSADGVGGFASLPGMRRYEDGSTERPDWFASPIVFPPTPFVVRVVDTTGSYLPVIHEIPAVPSETPVEIAVPRGPALAAPAGWLAATAQVQHPGPNGSPAAWALVVVEIGSVTVGGVTDERGAVTIPIPRGSAPTAVGTPQSGPIWRCTVRVRHQPSALVWHPDALDVDPPTIASIENQAPAQIGTTSPATFELQQDLRSGAVNALVSAPAATPAVLEVQPIP